MTFDSWWISLFLQGINENTEWSVLMHVQIELHILSKKTKLFNFTLILNISIKSVFWQLVTLTQYGSFHTSLMRL